MAEGKTKAPTVDGKRLAQLQSSVSGLALALIANGVPVPEGADPFEIACGRIKHAAELDDRIMALIGATTAVIGRFAPDMELAPLNGDEQLIDVQIRLLEQLYGAETPCDRRIHELEQKLAAGPDGATEGEIAAIARAEAAEKRVAELEEETGELKIDVEELATARNRLANQLAEEGKGQAGDEPELEEPEATPTVARERPDDARDVGPTFGRLTHVEMQQLVGAGAPLELAFSNGEFELVEFSSPPIEIAAADMIRVDSSRYIVGKAVHVKGADHPEELHGVGLLLEGSQVGYCPFDPPLLLLPGHEWKFDRQLVF